MSMKILQEVSNVCLTLLKHTYGAINILIYNALHGIETVYIDTRWDIFVLYGLTLS